ncbi:tyrosine-type recombinase/integrase [Paraglaciecola hydrolytica]|uniref:Tyr recombinase domain-containing protein n=1 Tax=Paraglaciecola hydrolytica TaxID=1799789 RepID=A0A148KKI6_9ALTE|nr:site-specific integrase [Paraglaciecola hydrolytica]KXI26789.1 hypothetical protein AX660_03195 [Paraglaciecola hydrolytica]
MATITKRPNGKWQVKVRRKGQKSLSKTFLTKALALKWARDVENKIDMGSFQSTCAAESHLFSDLIHKYWEEVVQPQKSSDVTIYALNRLIKTFPEHRMIDMTTEVIKEYKESRLKVVKGDTVRKDLLLKRRFFDYAINEWQIFLPKGNPVSSIALPKKGKSRDRRLEQGEYSTLINEALKYGGEIAPIIDLAIETGMRRGEITKLKWSNYNSVSRIVTIEDTKNGEDRVIPLSSKANAILQSQTQVDEFIFPIRGDSIGQAFRRITKRANLLDLRFHDLRHEATSRLFEKGLGIMEVSAITGHKDLAMLKKYTHLRAEDLVGKLG